MNGQDGDRRGANAGATFVTKNGDRFFIYGEYGDLVIARPSQRPRDRLCDAGRGVTGQ